MSTPGLITAGDYSYLSVEDLRLAFAVLIQGSVVDEVTGGPLHARLTVSASHPAALAKGFGGSLWCVSGYPEQVFPALPDDLTVSLSCPGYRPATVLVNVPASAVFPFDAGAIAMRPEPVRLQGRVVQVAGARDPIDGAAITTPTPDLTLLRTPIHLDHAAGVTVRRRALNAAVPATTVATSAFGGATTLLLNDVSTIAAGAILQLGSDRDMEFVIVSSVEATLNTVTLAGPIRRSLPAGSPVQRVTKGGVGTSQTLTRSALAGDGLLRLSGTLPEGTIEILDGASTEYAITGALTDARGYYRLDGVGGAVLFELQASAPTFVTQTTGVALDYTAPVNITDFRMSH